MELRQIFPQKQQLLDLSEAHNSIMTIDQIFQLVTIWATLIAMLVIFVILANPNWGKYRCCCNDTIQSNDVLNENCECGMSAGKYYQAQLNQLLKDS